jgi:hypothetical protein
LSTPCDRTMNEVRLASFSARFCMLPSGRAQNLQ